MKETETRSRGTGLPLFGWSATTTIGLWLFAPILPVWATMTVLLGAVAVTTAAGVRAHFRTYRLTSQMSPRSAFRFWAGNGPPHLYPAREQARVQTAFRAFLVMFGLVLVFFLYLIISLPHPFPPLLDGSQ